MEGRARQRGHAGRTAAVERDRRLAQRLERGLAASLGDDGLPHFDRLAMHIWLATTDELQSAYGLANGKALAGANGRAVFAATTRRMRERMRRVLPACLPLMAEFCEQRAILAWRDAGGGERVLAVDGFVPAAIAAGIPLTETDLIFALGPEGPCGPEVFASAVEQVRTRVSA